MPLVKSNYSPPWVFKNGHFSTIYSAKMRSLPSLLQKRERLTLLDGDFMDIDWSFSNPSKNRLAILLHGLEGNAQRTYIKGMAFKLIDNSWDVVAVNYRGCSGEKNRSYSSYNAGKTDDLEAIIDFILKKDKYQEIVLIGFSLGGNLILKYLGERETLPKQIIKGVAVSAPLSLKGSLEALVKPENWLFRTSFLINLKKKYKAKMPDFPEKMNSEDYKRIRSLLDFDDIYTAPAHGFKDAYDYYAKNSSNQFLPNIKVPVLILNAKNDSFLSPECYPFDLAEKSNNIFFESPLYGGHVGFHLTDKLYYSEQRAFEFIMC